MKSHPILSLFVFIGVCFLSALGGWQLMRAHQKETRLDNVAHGQQAVELSKTELLQISDPKAVRFHRTRIQANLNHDRIIFLDNQTFQGRPGYHVLVPAQLNEKDWILVNRGWIAMGPHRAQLPAVNPTLGKVLLQGYLDLPFINPLIKQATEQQTLHWPLRMQFIDLPFLEDKLATKLLPVILVLDEKSPYAFQALSPQSPYMTPSRHYGYAFQWFSLAATLVVWYLFFLRKQRKKAK